MAIVLFVQVFKVVICLRCQYMVFNSRAFVSWFGVESRQDVSHDAGSRAFVFMHLAFHRMFRARILIFLRIAPSRDGPAC